MNKPKLVVDNTVAKRQPSPEVMLRRLFRKMDRLTVQRVELDKQIRAESLRYADKHRLRVVPWIGILRATLLVRK